MKRGKIMYISSAKNSRGVIPRLRKAGQPLEVYIQQNQKRMEIWVPRREQQDQGVQLQIRDLFQKGKAADLSVAVFLSGNEDLQSLTSALLTCNQEKSAARQAESGELRQV